MPYERLAAVSPEAESEDEAEAPSKNDQAMRAFSWPEYAVFVLLGIAMLWAWNMFLAAAPYFQRRFRSNQSILANFQATEVSVSTLTNLSSMIILAKLQAKASYPRRIIISLLIYAAAYTLLAISTKQFLAVSAEAYFGFFVVMVLVSSIATGFMQNGTFAYASGFGRPDYMQGIMTGQAIAGILPPIVQVVTVLSARDEGEEGKEADNDGADSSGAQEASTSAMAYFITATVISAATIVAFVWLLRNTRRRSRTVEAVAPYADEVTGPIEANDSDQDSNFNPARRTAVAESEISKRKSVPLRVLARKLAYPAAAVFVTFAVTMVYPVFTQEILSTNASSSPLLKPAAFIPLAFLVWNIGDLLGRQIPLAPRLSLTSKPRILLLLAIVRFVYIPLYLLCNIQQPESPSSIPSVSPRTLPTAQSDFFYLVIVQLTFGLSNGYLGSCCMMGAGECVEPNEREAAGAYMGLCLVGGLTVGSLCSFYIGNATG